MQNHALDDEHQTHTTSIETLSFLNGCPVILLYAINRFIHFAIIRASFLAIFFFLKLLLLGDRTFRIAWNLGTAFFANVSFIFITPCLYTCKMFFIIGESALWIGSLQRNWFSKMLSHAFRYGYSWGVAKFSSKPLLLWPNSSLSNLSCCEIFDDFTFRRVQESLSM